MGGTPISPPFYGQAKPFLKIPRVQQHVVRLEGKPWSKKKRIGLERRRQCARNRASDSVETRENEALDAAAKEFAVGRLRVGFICEVRLH